MTSTNLAERRLARGAEVVLGPGLVRGTTVAHMVKNQATGDRYEVGPREFFVLSKLDGQRTLGEIGAEYAATFGRRLDDGAWGHLLGLLATRNLLAGAAALPTKPAARRGLQRLGPARGRYTFGDPSRFISRIYRRVSWMYHPWVVIPLIAVLAGMDVYLATHLAQLSSGVSTLLHQPSLAVLAVILLWGTAAGHEIAHGLTCRHFGGNASAIGVRWSGLFVAAYCTVDDVMLFPRRRARVATAAAGVIANHVFMLPFFVVWLVLPAHDATGDMLGVVVLCGIAQALFNYLPVSPLDGYHMLAHLLGLSNLADESRRYTRLRLAALLGRGPAPTGYPRWVGPVYLGYRVAVLLIAAGFLALLALWCYALALPALVPWLVGAVALFVLGRWYVQRKKLKKGTAA